MVDNRFPSVGVDARFPSPGTDVRFPTPGQDLEHLPDGTDTRFEGGTYGGAAGSPPVISVAPAVSGSSAQGSTLSCTTGTWTQDGGGGALSYAYQWTRDGANIGGATSSTYATTGSDVGTAVGCKVTATDVYGASSPATATGAVTVLSFSGAVAAMLAGTTGFALDPSDLTTMFQDTGETAPVTTLADPVRRIKSKWGTTVYNFDAPTDAARPAWDGTAGLDFDGSDDFIRVLATDVLRDKPAAFICTHEKMDALNYYSFQFSTASGANQRFSSSVNAGGAWAIGGRILDGDAMTFISSAAGVIATATEYVLSAQINYAVGKTVTGWCDGVSVISGTLGGTAGNTSNTASVTANFNGYNAGTILKNGKTGRVVMLPSIPSDPDRATIEAWVGELTL